MSTIAAENKNYYNSNSYPYIEKAVLAEAITFSSIKPLTGKFYIKVLTPEVNTSSETSSKPRTSSKVVNNNYINLQIPAYMLFQFMNPSIVNIDDHNCLAFKNSKYTIPKGTTFYVEFLGGDPVINKIIIIGISSTIDEEV